MKKSKWTETCWEELVNALVAKKLLSTYNVLGKKKFPKTQFFKHPVSHDEDDPDAISICINGLGDKWEIFLYADGKWELR
jgi:hypothetical protein